MKKLQYLLVLATVVLFATSCADSYLTQEPQGSSITEAQYLRMDNAIEGTVKGIYPLLYITSSSDQDWFGQRSIDLYGDILCGDAGMKKAQYGWFYSDELMQTYNRRSTLWAYYYNFVRACNKGINAVEGIHPSLEFKRDTLSDVQYLAGNYYAQLLTLRGWAYSKLCNFFVAQDAALTDPAIPIYTEDDTRMDTIVGAPRATVGDLYTRINDDLLTAINYFEAYNEAERSSKLEVNVDIARIILAYAYLNQGDNAQAYKYATQAIDSAKNAVILPWSELLTTGFNDQSNANWLWGQDVTVENSTHIHSFYAHVDIYTYGYASTGDVKGIDQILYDAIPEWDTRKLWFNNYYNKNINSSNKKVKELALDMRYAPDGKFYTDRGKVLDGDKNWLCDNLYMRWELPYLIAAEAAARQGDFTNAKTYLFDITDQRCDTAAANVTAYNTWKTGMADGDVLAAIKHNWRVELWGEGYGLQTFRRYAEAVTLGDNHLRQKKDISPTTARLFTFEIPVGEMMYNPFIRDTEIEGGTSEVSRRHQ